MSKNKSRRRTWKQVYTKLIKQGKDPKEAENEATRSSGTWVSPEHMKGETRQGKR